MVAEAEKKPRSERVRYVSGRGEALPIETGSADLVFMSMVLHHLESPSQSAGECRRVLRSGGAVCVRSPSIEQIPRYAYVPFMPGTVPILERRLTTARTIQSVFEAAGFSTRQSEGLIHKIAESWSEYAEKIAYRADSILSRLPDDEFAAGLERVRAHAAVTPSSPVSEPIDVFIFRAP